MKLLFASDSFKGSLSSGQTIALLTKAAKEVFGDCECVGVPVADGGEGTAEAVIAATNGTRIFAAVHNPLMQPIEASYGIFEGKAIIEMAAASGLPLIPEALRNPLRTTSFGTGELIRDALRRGCRDITVAIGGSATNDGGIGCLRALGARFYDNRGNELDGTGADLARVADIDLSGLDKRIRESAITVLCDVKNPLCGENGATRMFSRQKGATAEMTEALESGMCRYRDVIQATTGIDCDAVEGAGAAGGLGAALKVFLGGAMRSGIDAVLNLIHFDELLDGVDLVVTGEGKTDCQSACGKVMQGVAKRAKAKGIPVAGLSGSLGAGAEALYSDGVCSLMTTVSAPVTLEEAMQNAETLYRDAAVRMFRLIQIGMRIKVENR
ncbi:MAG: glycerate kinase [Ruminococcus sp.]|nr:glycerate kinase [Ruminococcus sp.]